MTDALVEIDGSFGEGGGQILRSSLALSLLTGKPFHLWNIRAGRAKPGLQPQHLQSVRAAAAIGQAEMRGASLNSTVLTFEPGVVKAGRYRFDIGTAGATSLILHTIYLPLALRGGEPSELTLTGGTHVKASPAFTFLDRTWRPYLDQLGLRVSLRILRTGFYPRGGGMIEAAVQPCRSLHGVTLVEHRPVNATGFAAVAGLDEGIARRMSRRATHRLKEIGIKADLAEETWDGGPGAVLAVELETNPVPTVFVGLGERGKPAERVADDVVDEVLRYIAAAPALVDPHSADQLVLPLAFAHGRSEFYTTAVTRHLTTNIAVIRRFVDREITCTGQESQPGVVRVS